MSTHEKLLPCPFCGGEARLDETTPDRFAAVFCSNCAIGTTYADSATDAISAWNRRASPPAATFDPAKTPGHTDMMVSPESLDEWLEQNPPPAADQVAFDPLEGGCLHCKWHDTNLGRVLDKKCDLHQRIEDLQMDLDLEMQVRQGNVAILNRVCDVIGADGEDDPVVVAQARMDEIRALEEKASPPAGVPEGWVMVPKEPTPEMCNAALKELSDITVRSKKAAAWDAVRAYRAMISAAPAAPTEASDE